MLKLSARQAIRNFHQLGEYAQWSLVTPDAHIRGHETVQGAMGGARAYQGRADISIRPKFTLPGRPRIFATGSCFAREVELALHAAGMSVLSWTPESTIRNDAFHRYNTFSMLNDFRFAFEGGWSEALAVETPVGWADYSGHQICPTRQALIDERRAVIDLHRNVAQADVLIVTLGLVEVWFDKLAQTVLNFTPSEILATNLTRFEFRVTNYEQNLEALRALVAYVRRLNAALKVIVTVSPVPLNASFAGLDICQSNTLSKATLRTVAQAVADENEFVDYFPSYEIVTLSDPQAAWMPDRRHVRRETVEFIIDKFRGAYLVGDA